MPSAERLCSKFHSCLVSFASQPTVHFSDNLSALGIIFRCTRHLKRSTVICTVEKINNNQLVTRSEKSEQKRSFRLYSQSSSAQWAPHCHVITCCLVTWQQEVENGGTIENLFGGCLHSKILNRRPLICYLNARTLILIQFSSQFFATYQRATELNNKSLISWFGACCSVASLYIFSRCLRAHLKSSSTRKNIQLHSIPKHEKGL